MEITEVPEKKSCPEVRRKMAEASRPTGRQFHRHPSTPRANPSHAGARVMRHPQRRPVDPDRGEPRRPPARSFPTHRRQDMRSIIYLVGLVVVIGAIASVIL